MKKEAFKRIFLVVLIFQILILSGCPAHLERRTDDRRKLPLWKIESKTNTVYILGSVHFLKEENCPLDPAIENAFNESQVLVLEVNLDDFNTPQTQRSMLLASMCDPGNTLSQTLSQETFGLLRTRLEENGLKVEQFEMFKPWFLAVSVTATILQNAGFDPNFGIEKYFFDKAKSSGKEILGLETVEYQIGLFDDMSPEVQDFLLYKTLLELDVIEEQVEELVRLWKAGDLEVIDSKLSEELTDNPQLNEKLIYERNRNWVPRIKAFVGKDKNVLVTVGAGHLGGEKGLVALLKKEVRRIEQM